MVTKPGIMRFFQNPGSVLAKIFMVTKHIGNIVPLSISSVLAKIFMVTKLALPVTVTVASSVLAKIFMVTKQAS